MNFFTKVNIERSKLSISHADNIILIGSCFTDEIGAKFEQNGFSILKNPLGILYNPLSISVCLNYIADKSFLIEDDLIKSGEYYYAFSFHGDYRGETKQECLQKINDAILSANNFLQKTTCLVITLGSAWTYWYRPLNYLMGNCHKISSNLIERKILSIEQICKALGDTIQKIQSINKQIKIILTISPVRHIREGLYDNHISKSTLTLAVDKLINDKTNDIAYFPSYEIVMDELRDYRFYAKDMIHVNETTVDYIWERFSQTFFSEETLILNEKYYKLYLMKNHRPLNPQSVGYKKHLEKIRLLKEELNKLS